MEILIINGEEVRQLLPMDQCMDRVAAAFKALARGEALNPLRPVMTLPDGSGVLVMMPAYLGDIQAMGTKVISVMPGNHGTPYDSHQGAVMLFETQHGLLKALIDATAITAIRTAAASGVATRLLACAEADDLALLGSGVQASTHLDAMLAVRPVRRVRVWSRNLDHARQFAARESERVGVAVEAVDSAQAAVTGASIICAVTAATEPVLFGDWLTPGAHINAVGACVPAARELDTAAVQRAELYTDRRESLLAEAGDFLIPRDEGALDESHLRGELGALLLNRAAGRSSPAAITLYKSLGLGIQDLAAAALIYQQALAMGLGTAVEFGGERL